MRKTRLVPIGFIALVVVSLLALYLIGYLPPKGAGIIIETNPASSVFVDGEEVGRTPYRDTRKPGEVVLKLIPESFDKPLVPFETKLNLVSGVETVVRRDFAESDEKSAGEILSFEKEAPQETSLAVVSYPNSSLVLVDGMTRGFAPYKASNLSPGEHIFTVSAKGYLDRPIKVKLHKGYKLTAVVKLSPSDEDQIADKEPVGENNKEEQPVLEVKILSTPTGFLRVRSLPSTTGDEVARVVPGSRYPFLEEDKESGWYKIEYQKGEGEFVSKTGWVSNTYAELVEKDRSQSESLSEVVSTPTPSL